MIVTLTLDEYLELVSHKEKIVAAVIDKYGRIPIAVDPEGCGCTECMVGEYVPEECADSNLMLLVDSGQVQDNRS